MNLVPNIISRTVAREALKYEKHSPAILFGAGVAGMVTSTVLACRATLKLEDALEKTQHDLELAKEVHTEKPEIYSDADFQQDKTVIYIRGAVSIGKLYAPAVGVGILSVAALTRSHSILNQRNVALTAAYAAIEKGFNEYRLRVVEKYGAEVDRDFRYGSEDVEITDEKTGRKKIVTRAASGSPSIYARFFDATAASWSKDPEYNRVYLQSQQNYLNQLLHARGHVFLNEAYDALGIERSSAGSVVGWLITKGEGDNYIDFGIFNGEHVEDFVNGKEGSILLDFNVDGVIYDKIEDTGEKVKWQLDN